MSTRWEDVLPYILHLLYAYIYIYLKTIRYTIEWYNVHEFSRSWVCRKQNINKEFFIWFGGRPVELVFMVWYINKDRNSVYWSESYFIERNSNRYRSALNTFFITLRNKKILTTWLRYLKWYFCHKFSLYLQ